MEGAWPNRDFNTGVVFFDKAMKGKLKVGVVSKKKIKK